MVITAIQQVFIRVIRREMTQYDAEATNTKYINDNIYL